MMISRLIELKDSFQALVQRDVMDEETNWTEEQWDALVGIKALLVSFMIVQKVLEGQNYPTASLVPYLIKKSERCTQESCESQSSSRHT